MTKDFLLDIKSNETVTHDLKYVVHRPNRVATLLVDRLKLKLFKILNKEVVATIN